MSDSFDVNRYWLDRGRRYVTEARLAHAYHRSQEQFILEHLRHPDLPARSILELGCGFGRVTRLVAGAFPASSITALDLSPDQLAHARAHCAGLDQVSFHPYDFYSGAPFPGGPFDLTLAIEVFLHHPSELIRQLLGRLRHATRFLAHLDWFEPWTGPLPPHVWIHDYPAFYRELGWEWAAWPLPDKIEGKQQVFFLAGEKLPPGIATGGPMDAGLGAPQAGSRPTSEEELESQSWEHRLVRAIQDLVRAVPEGAAFILADGDEWGLASYPGGRRRLHFLDRDGQYWGPPASDAQAWDELMRLREAGAGWLVVGWNQFWLLSHFADWRERLRERFPCVLENHRLAVFCLNP